MTNCAGQPRDCKFLKASSLLELHLRPAAEDARVIKLLSPMAAPVKRSASPQASGSQKKAKAHQSQATTVASIAA
eukprot:4704805-Amphidinium_carterae.1